MAPPKESCSPIGCPFMDEVGDTREDCGFTFVENVEEVQFGLGIVEVKVEFVCKLFEGFVAHVLDAGIDHEVENVDDEFRVFAEIDVRVDTLFSEVAVDLAIFAAHAFHHLLAELDWRWVGFRVLTKNETKVDMEEFPGVVHHDVFQVAVSHAKEVRHDAVPCATQHVVFYDLRV